MLRGAERSGRKEGGRREGCRGAAAAQVQGGWKLPDHRAARSLPPAACTQQQRARPSSAAQACGGARPRPDGVKQPRHSETQTSLPRAAFGGCWILVMVLAKGRSPGGAAPCAHAAAPGRTVAAHRAVATRPPLQEQGCCCWLSTNPSPHAAWPRRCMTAAPRCHRPKPLAPEAPTASLSQHPAPQGPQGHSTLVAMWLPLNRGWMGASRAGLSPTALGKGWGHCCDLKGFVCTPANTQQPHTARGDAADGTLACTCGS